MTTHAEAFRKALVNVEPNLDDNGDGDARNAQAAHNQVRDALKADDKLANSWGVKPKLIGSYARDVSIRRVKDVDVFCRLTTAPETLQPGQAMTEFGRVLEGAYGDRCERQHRSYKIDFPDYDLCVDVVPAKPFGDNWQVPSRDPKGERGTWVETNPLRLSELTSEMNATFYLGQSVKGMYVPTVKLVRQVRRHVLGPDSQPGGLFLELMTYWVFNDRMNAHNTVAEYLEEALRHLADYFDDVIAEGLPDPTVEGKTISTRAKYADLTAARKAFKDVAATATNALKIEGVCESAREWQKVLGTNCDGEVFELPSFCDAAALSASGAASSRVPGSDRVPAGRDTYA